MTFKKTIKRDEEFVKHLYYDLGYSIDMMSEALQIKRGTMRGWMKKFITLRTRSEAHFMAYKKGRRKDITGAKHPKWKGGRHRSYGYVLIWLSSNDPLRCMATSNNRYIFEHRLVMAKHLGRPLVRNEWVHHLNGVRDDNRLANLALTAPQNHKTNTLQKHFQKRIRELEEQLAQQRF